MITPRHLTATLAALTMALAGCITTPATTPSPTLSASPTLSGPELTQPGAASAMIARLIAAAGSRQLIQVEITRSEARISVLKDADPQTWAWRDGEIKQVDTDILDVNQRTFVIEAFDISDVGSLFRRAAAVAGSDRNQELQIVDSSAGSVMMTVSTVPESHTVFFYPDGRMLPTLDFTTEGGITAGLTDAIGNRLQAMAMGVRSDLGAYLDYSGTPGKTIIRRLRTASVPTTIIERADRTSYRTFAPSDVDPAIIWAVVSKALTSGRLQSGQPWSVQIDDREVSGAPKLHFVFGTTQLVTDLSGTPVRQP